MTATDTAGSNPYALDDEILAFIDRYSALSSQLSAADGIEQQRSNYASLVAQMRYPRPPGISSEDSEISARHGSLELRHYRYRQDSSPARLMFIHGGGFIFGNLDSHDDICADICAATGLNLVSVDYRLSPEFHHPVHLDDVEDAFHHCYHPGMVVIGASAGGTLSAALAHRLKKARKKPAAQLLIFPGLGGDALALASYQENAQAPLLSTEDVLFYRDARCASGQLPPDDAEFYPLLAKDYAGLPKTIAISADIDPLRDDARLYVERLQAAGVEARWINHPGLVHDFLRARHSSKKAAAAFAGICDAAVQLAG